MFQWDFDKPSAPVNFETTLSQDLLEFNNVFNQNVSAQISPIPAQAMPPMNFSGKALSNFQEQEEQPIIDYMTYNAPQPTEIENLGDTPQPITNQEYTGLLDAQEGLNPYGQNQNQT